MNLDQYYKVLSIINYYLIDLNNKIDINILCNVYNNYKPNKNTKKSYYLKTKKTGNTVFYGIYIPNRIINQLEATNCPLRVNQLKSTDLSKKKQYRTNYPIY